MDFTETQRLIEALRELPDGAVLKSDLFAPLCEYFDDAGKSLLLSTPSDYYLIFFDLPEAIDEITTQNVSWLFETDEKAAALTIFADSKEMQIHHTFYLANNPANGYFFKSMRDSGSVTIHFFALQYGDIYNHKTITFILPSILLQQIECYDAKKH